MPRSSCLTSLCLCSSVKKQEEVQNLTDDIENLMKDLRQRNRAHKDMRRALKTLTIYKFDELLRMNKYSGELIFDDGGDGKAGTLDLVVAKGSGGQTTDVKGLRYEILYRLVVTWRQQFCMDRLISRSLLFAYQWWRAKLFDHVSALGTRRKVGDTLSNL